MGYESKLYIVEPCPLSVDKKGFIYAEVIAMIDLCKVHMEVNRFFAKKSNCYIYVGDKKVKKDLYGEELVTCTDLPGLIAWMKQQAQEAYYRRWGMAIALLEAIKPNDWENIQVLHYGH